MKSLKDFENYMIEEELSANTRSSYMHAMRDFFSQYKEINRTNVIEWKNRLMEQLKPKSVNLRISAIEKYCKFKGITIPIKRVKVQKMGHVENVITAEQYEKLIEGLESDGLTRWIVIVKLMAKTGARISEVLRFTKHDLETGHVDMPTKGKVRRIYFPKNLVQEIYPYISDMEDNDVLCTNRFGGPITARGVSQGLKTYSKKYGIPRENAHPHAFRHFFAIEFLKRNNNISLLADLLGHSGVNTTMIYLRMDQKQQKEAIDNAVNW